MTKIITIPPVRTFNIYAKFHSDLSNTFIWYFSLTKEVDRPTNWPTDAEVPGPMTRAWLRVQLTSHDKLLTTILRYCFSAKQQHHLRTQAAKTSRNQIWVDDELLVLLCGPYRLPLPDQKHKPDIDDDTKILHGPYTDHIAWLEKQILNSRRRVKDKLADVFTSMESEG